jgi:glycolate oxidase iron-sulfur subunit
VQEATTKFLGTRPAALLGEVKVKATYSDSCHLRHEHKIIKQPRELLKKIPGLELVELKLPDRCCGSAGVYNIVHPDTADAILDTKMADIAATGADLIVASNTGCHMQLIAGARRAGLKARVMHVAEVLETSYQAQDPKGF